MHPYHYERDVDPPETIEDKSIAIINKHKKVIDPAAISVDLNANKVNVGMYYPL